MQPILVMIGLFVIRIAVPVAIVLYLGARQERHCDAAF